MRGARDTPKSEAGERTIALGPRLAEELWHRRRTAFSGDDERVFCHPEKGSVLDHKRYAKTLREALAKAKVDKPMRPFHDGRHTSITNAAAAGLSPAALMARAGHSDFKTTQGYIDLAGEPSVLKLSWLNSGYLAPKLFASRVDAHDPATFIDRGPWFRSIR